MGAPCTACSHANRETIDAEMVQGGASQRSIATRYGLSKDAIRRHSKHVSASLARVTEERETAGARTAMERAEELYGKASRVLDAAEAGNNASLSLQAIRELRALVEFLARMTGELDDRPTVQVLNVATSPEWLRLRATLQHALAPYPEAGQAVAARLVELEASP